MMREIKKALDPVKHRISLMLGRAVLSLISDAEARQYVQFEALKGEVKDRVERVQQYGFTSVPHPGAQVVFVAMGGNRDHLLAISVDDPRHRLFGLEIGEAAMFTDEGDKIVLKRGRTIEITTKNLVVKASEKVLFETPVLECTGEIKDRSTSGGQTMSEMRTTYNTHIHPENGGTGPTSVPNQPMGT